MIFITVGTHEQQFNRLVKYIEELKGHRRLEEEVIIQTGYSTYIPRYVLWQKLFSYQEMNANVSEARIVITHGGPSSFIMPLQIGKIPIVVPRQKQFGEHVNNHQVEFAREVVNRQGNIIAVYEIELLEQIIKNYESIVAAMPRNVLSNNGRFNQEINRIVEEMFSE